ncbi:PDZ domain-containing protein [Ferrimonas gelatinilytica]|uniref:PDZ domain-containing protein n=1 Tax=Ferrimonas gelatinilytica TaxID=1255257 RepID=A0ABP9S1K3_9GAMM
MLRILLASSVILLTSCVSTPMVQNPYQKFYYNKVDSDSDTIVNHNGPVKLIEIYSCEANKNPRELELGILRGIKLVGQSTFANSRNLSISEEFESNKIRYIQEQANIVGAGLVLYCDFYDESQKKYNWWAFYFVNGVSEIRIGFQSRYDNDSMIVNHIIEGSSAWNAGLEKEDRIISIEGESCESHDDKCAEILKGNELPISAVIERDQIEKKLIFEFSPPVLMHGDVNDNNLFMPTSNKLASKRYDRFENVYFIESEPYQGTLLRAKIDGDTKEIRALQVYVDINSFSEWKHFDKAFTDDSVPRKLVNIDSSVDCDKIRLRYSNICLLTEVVGVYIDIDYLRSRHNTGFELKLSGKQSKVITVAQFQVAQMLRTIDNNL